MDPLPPSAKRQRTLAEESKGAASGSDNDASSSSPWEFVPSPRPPLPSSPGPRKDRGFFLDWNVQWQAKLHLELSERGILRLGDVKVTSRLGQVLNLQHPDSAPYHPRLVPPPTCKDFPIHVAYASKNTVALECDSGRPAGGPDGTLLTETQTQNSDNKEMTGDAGHYQPHGCDPDSLPELPLEQPELEPMGLSQETLILGEFPPGSPYNDVATTQVEEPHEGFPQCEEPTALFALCDSQEVDDSQLV